MDFSLYSLSAVLILGVTTLFTAARLAHCQSINYLISGLRRPEIAESAIRSAGMALIIANEVAKSGDAETLRLLAVMELR